MASIRWTHPSVVRVVEKHSVRDPYAWIEHRARELALTAMERGWAGPPYDAFELAEALGVEVVARQDLDDARLVQAGGQPRIEFNPQRRPARIRFSIAHELGHYLFEDYAERTRYRDLEQRRDDDWQLEVLCNVAAAELLMPAGALPISEASDLDLIRLVDERQRFGVSMEALLRRVVRLTNGAAAIFAAARLDDAPTFRIDYTVPSRAWRPPVSPGDVISDSVLARCTAVGYADSAVESWNGAEVRVQAVGVPPYPGATFPRVVGILQPPSDGAPMDVGVKYVRGDAAAPRADGLAIIAHVVNDKALRWGGRGFVHSLMERYPDAALAFAARSTDERRLGAVHLHEAAKDTWIASMVAQAGYGPALSADQPRLRLHALRAALERVADAAERLGASVHMPLIGTGQGGTRWPKIRDLVLDELGSRHVPVTVYILPDAPMPEETSDAEQVALL